MTDGRGMSMKKAFSFLRIILIVLIVAAVAVYLFFTIRAALAAPRMLRAAGLETYPGLKKIDYTVWTDPLAYCTGYEIMAFSVDGNFDPPADWETSDEPVGIEAFEERYHIELYVNEILALSLGGDDCVAWRLVDHRGDAVDFDQRDYYLAYCYRAYNKDLLFIYRGHHLYGEMFFDD